IGKAFLSVTIGADDPNSFFLKFFDRSGDVCRFCDREMSARSGRCLGDGFVDGGRVMFRYDPAVSTEADGSPNKGAEVVRVFNFIKEENECFLILRRRNGKNLIQVSVLFGSNDRYNSLRARISRELVDDMFVGL